MNTSPGYKCTFGLLYSLLFLQDVDIKRELNESSENINPLPVFNPAIVKYEVHISIQTPRSDYFP